MNNGRKPLIIIVSAPSGSGKTTLISGLLEKMPRLRRSVSYTTRLPREGEKDEEDYIFVSKQEFVEKKNAGGFLEWEENFGNYYGTPKDDFQDAVEEGDDLVLSIDVKGARKIKQIFPESVSIFIMPPSAEELAARLKKRNTDRKDEVSLRLKESQVEIEAADEYDYLIVNEDLEEAVGELEAVINEERKNRDSKK
ncbi:MAG: guanylate kinase [Candidatus Omnitrophota bacterium]